MSGGNDRSGKSQSVKAKSAKSRNRQARTSNNQVVARNRRARYDYEILETVECGLVLHGSEVKSLRMNQVSLTDAYARIHSGEIWLVGMHIAPYTQAGAYGMHDPERSRKLLLHRKQINYLAGKTLEKSLTLIPLSIYFKDGKAKASLGLARGKRMWDKRKAIQERDAMRDASREVAQATRRAQRTVNDS
ncbi:MAG: SsrA-binding protein SmpB [Actinobacteria bacterium]|jgi:SsrA-binding protein|nr:SsrA-binding protein SmpB [Actinomycetota bacterium]